MRREQEEVRTFQLVSVTCAHMPMEKPQGAGVEMAVTGKEEPVSTARRKKKNSSTTAKKVYITLTGIYMNSTSVRARKVVVVYSHVICLLSD